MSEFNLSEKMKREGSSDLKVEVWSFEYKDVKEFIRILKEELENLRNKRNVDLFYHHEVLKIIDKHAGEKLI